MKSIQITESGTAQPTDADEIRIYLCDDCELIHVLMVDVKENVLAEMAFEPETALSIARRIEQAADRALGVT